MAIARPSLPWPCGREKSGEEDDGQREPRRKEDTNESERRDAHRVSGKTALRSRATSSSRGGPRARGRERATAFALAARKTSE